MSDSDKKHMALLEKQVAEYKSKLDGSFSPRNGFDPSAISTAPGK